MPGGTLHRVKEAARRARRRALCLLPDSHSAQPERPLGDLSVHVGRRPEPSPLRSLELRRARRLLDCLWRRRLAGLLHPDAGHVVLWILRRLLEVRPLRTFHLPLRPCKAEGRERHVVLERRPRLFFSEILAQNASWP